MKTLLCGAALALAPTAVGCECGSGGATETDGGSTTTDAATSSETDAGTTTTADAAIVGCESATEGAELIACATQAFLDTLTTDQQDTAVYDFTDSTNKTCWSNLPGQDRPGITFGELSDTSLAAAFAIAAAVTTDDGYSDLRGVVYADDYLGSVSGGGGGGGGGGGLSYSSDNVHIAVFGTPSLTGDWMLSIGNHHMAYNVTFSGGTGYPTPNHLGAEPRTEFTVNSETFSPLTSDGQAFIDLFASLSSTELTASHLSGSFGDIVLGPDEYCTGDYSNVVFPTGSSRTGVLVSSLTSEQQALVTATIEEWVRDYDPSIADALMTEYTSSAAYADTYIGWGGSGSAPDVLVSGTYFRIDGPRVWIEVAVQAGVVLSGTHYHTMYRDKSYDYGAEL